MSRVEGRGSILTGVLSELLGGEDSGEGADAAGADVKIVNLDVVEYL